MQFTLNDPVIRNFLANIPNNYHTQTIRQLILIGINMVSGALQGKTWNKPQGHHYQHQNLPHQQCQHTFVLHQIKNIKAKIDELSSLLIHDHNSHNQENLPVNLRMSNHFMNRNQSQKTGFYITDGQPINKKIVVNNIDDYNINIPTKEAITPKVTQTVPYIAEQCHIQDRKHPSRRHLDDTQFKQAMVYPVSPENSKKKNKKRQQAINNETIVHQVFERGSMINKNDMNIAETKPIVTGQSVPRAKSKIKNLVDRDKLKHQFMGKHNSEINVEIYTKPPKKNPPPLHYSDEDSSSSIPNFKQNLKQKPRQRQSEIDFQPYHIEESEKEKRRRSEMPRSRKNEPQIKINQPRASQPAEIRKPKLEIEHQQQSSYRPNQMDSYNPSAYKDIINDNSSSFSQFSLGSRNSKRQVGKISRKI